MTRSLGEGQIRAALSTVARRRYPERDRAMVPDLRPHARSHCMHSQRALSSEHVG